MGILFGFDFSAALQRGQIVAGLLKRRCEGLFVGEMKIDDGGDVIGVGKNGTDLASQNFPKGSNEAIVVRGRHADGGGVVQRIENDRMGDGGYFAGQLIALSARYFNFEWIDECFADAVAPKLTYPGVRQQMAFRDLLDDREGIFDMTLTEFLNQLQLIGKSFVKPFDESRKCTHDASGLGLARAARRRLKRLLISLWFNRRCDPESGVKSCLISSRILAKS